MNNGNQPGGNQPGCNPNSGAKSSSFLGSAIPWLVIAVGIALGFFGYILVRNWTESQTTFLSSRPASTARNLLASIPEDDLGYAFQTLIQVPNVDKARDFILSPSGGWLILLNDKLNFYRNGTIPTAFTTDYPKSWSGTDLKRADSVCWDPVSSEETPVLFLGTRAGIVRYSVENQLQEAESEEAVAGKAEAGKAGPEETEEAANTPMAGDNQAANGTEKTISNGKIRELDQTVEFINDGFSERSVITCLIADTERIYVADAGKSEARIYDRKSGKCTAVLNPPEGRFSVPSPYMDLALDASGVVWVADPGRHRLVPFKTDGTCLESQIWGAQGQDLPRFCGCCNPAHFLILDDGRFLTAEKNMPRVKIYSESGVWETAVAGETQMEADPETVVQIAVAPDGWIYVLDPQKKQIIAFVEKRLPISD